MPEAAVIEPVEELVTVHAAAVRSGRTRSQITNAILRNALRAVRSGDRILIPVEALDQFVATHGEPPRRSA